MKLNEIHTKSGKRVEIYHDEDFSIEEVLGFLPGDEGRGEVKILAYHDRYMLGHNQIKGSELEHQNITDVLEDVTGINVGDDEFYNRVKQYITEAVQDDEEEEDWEERIEEEMRLFEDNFWDTCEYEELITQALFELAQERNLAMVQQLYIYDHGGITIWTSRPNHLGRIGGWDTSTIGYVITDLSQVKEFLPEGEDLLTFAEKHADLYIKELDNVCRGEVFSVVVEAPETCACCGSEMSADTLDTLGGIVGQDQLKEVIVDLEGLSEDEVREVQTEL